MEKLKRILALTAGLTAGLIFIAPNSALAFKQSYSQISKECSTRVFGDRFIPWPWGKEIDIPWTEMQGTWRIESESHKSYFSFKVVDAEHQEFRQLQVTELSARTCQKVSSGLGWEADNVVKAVLRTDGSPERQVFALRGFNTADVPCLSLPQEQQRVMVVSLRNMTAIESDHYMISKISSSQNDCPIEE